MTSTIAAHYPVFCHDLQRRIHETDTGHISPNLRFENGLEIYVGKVLSSEIVHNSGAFFSHIHAVSHGYQPDGKTGLVDVTPRDGRLWDEAIDLFIGNEYATLMKRYDLASKSTIAVKVDPNNGTRNILYGLYDLDKKRLVLIGAYRIK